MRLVYLQLCVLTVTVTPVLILIYKYLWRRQKPEVVPTGVGVLCSLPLVAAFISTVQAPGLNIAGLILTIAGVFYWIDDMSGLSARMRVLIAFVTGVIVSHLAITSYIDFTVFYILVIIFIGGLINLGLVNSINFYDGADLNVSTLIILQCSFLILYSPLGHWMHSGAAVLICFALSFILFNRFPNNIYFGDSGCFVFAGFLTLVTVTFIVDPHVHHPEIFIPLALPVFDVAFVLTQRVWQKHDLLSRNYMHLYQRLQRRFNDKRYLTPPVSCSVITLFAATMIELLGTGSNFAVWTSIIFVTPTFYFTMRAIYVSGEPEGPLQEKRH